MSLISLQSLILFFAFRSGAEQVAVSSADLNLPAGRILGAAFSDDAKNVFVQQVAFSSEKTDQSKSITSRLRLSSWSIDGRSMTAQRDLGFV